MDLPERLAYLDGPWSNDACRGYMIAVLLSQGKAPAEIEQAVKRLESMFDRVSVADAKKLWYDFEPTHTCAARAKELPLSCRLAQKKCQQAR